MARSRKPDSPSSFGDGLAGHLNGRERGGGREPERCEGDAPTISIRRLLSFYPGAAPPPPRRLRERPTAHLFNESIRVQRVVADGGRNES